MRERERERDIVAVGERHERKADAQNSIKEPYSPLSP
jgi:hypothetical protein